MQRNKLISRSFDNQKICLRLSAFDTCQSNRRLSRTFASDDYCRRW